MTGWWSLSHAVIALSAKINADLFWIRLRRVPHAKIWSCVLLAEHVHFRF